MKNTDEEEQNDYEKSFETFSDLRRWRKLPHEPPTQGIINV
jgi:hypothetical protein